MNNAPIVRVFDKIDDLIRIFAIEIVEGIEKKKKENSSFSLLLSGGSTPKVLFEYLANKKAAEFDSDYVKIFWGDERMVPPTDSESNYGMTNNAWISKVQFNPKNIFRVRGEDSPENEVERYSDLILNEVAEESGLPEFDLIILGLGDDGHTASIFPDNLELLKSDKICAVAAHPVTGQKRITVTGKVINNAKRVAFLVTGAAKASVIKEIMNNEEKSVDYPAAYIKPKKARVEWLLDTGSAKNISILTEYKE